jgi:hypothetical protein
MKIAFIEMPFKIEGDDAPPLGIWGAGVFPFTLVITQLEARRFAASARNTNHTPIKRIDLGSRFATLDAAKAACEAFLEEVDTTMYGKRYICPVLRAAILRKRKGAVDVHFHADFTLIEFRSRMVRYVTPPDLLAALKRYEETGEDPPIGRGYELQVVQ